MYTYKKKKKKAPYTNFKINKNTEIKIRLLSSFFFEFTEFIIINIICVSRMSLINHLYPVSLHEFNE